MKPYFWYIIIVFILLVVLVVSYSSYSIHEYLSDKNLEIGVTFYNALLYHMEEALLEKNVDIKDATNDPRYAIFSRKYYNDIKNLNRTKIYDFCFIGSINSCRERREWVIEFAKKNFTKNSIFINTDNDPTWEVLGTYDLSKKNIGFNPKASNDNQSKKVQYRVVSENLFYFETMCQSKYILCPAGDAPWSFRFYEVLMCDSIPVVESWHHTYRTEEESKIKYKYILYTDNIDDLSHLYDSYVHENTKLFEKYHLL